MECEVCCEKINRSTNARVECPNPTCEFIVCKKCVRHYLMESMDMSHCMNCKAQWGRLYSIEKLNRSFWVNDYTPHRKEILTEREMSKIPETIEYAAQVKRLDLLAVEKKRLTGMKSELIKQVKKLQMDIYEVERKQWEIKHGIGEGTGIGGSGEKEERKRFTMSCQNPDCNGFLSQQYKCEICNLYTCSKCLEFMDGENDDAHECNPDNIKTADEIRATTKPCPNCSQRIYKVSGCDQMWCIDCKVSFSWNSGRIIMGGVIHNPHYYEYLQKVNGGEQANRNPQDVPCGGLINFYTIANILITIDRDKKYNLSKLHQVISDITYNRIVMLREKVLITENMRDLRADYILKKISREDFSARILHNDKINQKSREELHVYELLSVYGIEFFRAIYDMKAGFSIDEEIEKFRNLIEYCNAQFRVIGATYNYISTQLSPETYRYSTIKATIASLKG